MGRILLRLLRFVKKTKDLAGSHEACEVFVLHLPILALDHIRAVGLRLARLWTGAAAAIVLLHALPDRQCRLLEFADQ